MSLLFRICEESPGIIRYRLDVASLYRDGAAVGRFEERLSEFLECIPEEQRTLQWDGEYLEYLTESYLPQDSSGRKRILLALGNPATQSVAAGVCFAHELHRTSEHRFWSALRSSGLLELRPREADETPAVANARRARSLRLGDYSSPYLVGIDVMFTLPSPASHPKWSGVAGLKRLLGAPAFRRLWKCEQLRLKAAAADFLDENGIILAFQKEAFDGLRAVTDRGYSLEWAKAGGLASITDLGDATPARIVGMPPTRFAHCEFFVSGLKAAVREKC